jgi:2-polyprenyl-3-methyl-5-hydroxy-6-metoxy-1,4-benzoquinol methylase
MRAIDIGCGAGHNAAWLADQGLEVTGVDFADHAIERARSKFGEVAGLHLEVVDVTQANADL